jgi:hypothetical protein
MGRQLSFYDDLTQIAEGRIKELICHAEQVEAQESCVPVAASYFRDCAVCVFLAWRDVTEGWQVPDDLERLEALTNGTTWVA